VKTVLAEETALRVNDISFRLVDVRGVREDRKGWFRSFADVSAVIFVVALSEYSLALAEDPTRVALCISSHPQTSEPND